MPIITMLNQKGGVGKTSTCHHLAGTLGPTWPAGVYGGPARSPSFAYAGATGTSGDRPTTRSSNYHRQPSTGATTHPRNKSYNRSGCRRRLIPRSKYTNDFNLPRPHEANWESSARTSGVCRGSSEPLELGRLSLTVRQTLSV